ncbi:MAG: FHA domain-containing protein [Deltaproteobacteria bacterium]|nr:FHA domain-containing protein [Deltaproteobacteria bacterium]MBW2717069.1 FHA domain-containing protein [Deltaproteobacteria bacterium]
MEQARNYVCTECASAVPSGHKFCGACGAGVPTEAQTLETRFFGALQMPGKARLIVVRGDEAMGEGLSYLLQATEHVAGREADQIPFPSDNWLSPSHANFLYRGEKLVVRDEGSLNGVYIRIRGASPIQIGDHFMCGQQLFRIDATPKDTSGPEPDQTHFYASPRRPSAFRVTQVLEGGMDGIVCCAHEQSLQIGREECDINFPDDVHMSPRHARVEMSGESLELLDENSQNGTYVRIRGERELSHGDYLFLGRNLLRVEVTA